MIGALSRCLGLIACILVLFAGQGRAETFRWVDENGVTHYSDQVPPEAVKQRRTRLSPQGRELNVIEAPQSAEQLRQEQQLKQLRSRQAKILAEQRDQDLALLRTYRNTEEMRRALQGKLDTLDSTAKITETNRQRQKDQLASQEQRAAGLEREGHPVSQNLRDLILATRRQITEYDAKLREIQAEKAALTERFNKDIARFEIIKAQQSGSSGHLESDLSSSAGRAPKDETLLNAIACVGQVCNRAWGLAREYVLKYSGGSLAVDTERILQTPPPAAETDFGITVTRITDKSETILFLDVRCRPSSLGDELCAGPRVKAMRANFKPYIEAGLGPASSDHRPAAPSDR